MPVVSRSKSRRSKSSNNIGTENSGNQSTGHHHTSFFSHIFDSLFHAIKSSNRHSSSTDKCNQANQSPNANNTIRQQRPKYQSRMSKLMLVNHNNHNNSTNSNGKSRKFEGVFPLTNLPEELIIRISQSFNLDMIYNLSLVSRDMYRLVQDVGLWKFNVEKQWMPQANKMSLLAQEGLTDFSWKNYYHLREITSGKGVVSAISLRIKGPGPSARYQHTGTVVGSSIYYIGGQETQLRRFSDIFRYDTETHRFHRVHVNGGKVPKFARHTSVSVGNKIYVFGGFDGSGVYFDLSIFDTETFSWTSPVVHGKPPRSRTNHASAVIGSKLYVFGGINRDSRWELQDLDEFYVFDTQTMTWSEVEAKGDLPSSRCGHRLVTVGTKLYMFGGGAGDSWKERFNDIHIFDTITSEWRHVPSNQLVQVCTFSCVFLIGHLVGVFGGQHLIKGKVTKKLYFFDTISETWSKQVFHHGVPSPRDMASADVVGDKVYMFGGYDGRAMDDLTVMSFSTELRTLLQHFKPLTNINQHSKLEI
ncbi:hypothetical protein SAMD00019534_030390, partial [Acytostelium subglobosum LB1]|uniref:hypothetical protein n=1 Tax=Acytostelium subglobosum LB1 TaxID=1410327 RepID=UPI000644F3C7